MKLKANKLVLPTLLLFSSASALARQTSINADILVTENLSCEMLGEIGAHSLLSGVVTLESLKLEETALEHSIIVNEGSLGLCGLVDDVLVDADSNGYINANIEISTDFALNNHLPYIGETLTITFSNGLELKSDLTEYLDF